MEKIDVPIQHAKRRASFDRAYIKQVKMLSLKYLKENHKIATPNLNPD